MHQEHRAPADGLDQQSAEGRSGGEANRGRDVLRGQGAAALSLIEKVGHGGLPGSEQHRGTEALDPSRHDEPDECRREAGECRAQREDAGA